MTSDNLLIANGSRWGRRVAWPLRCSTGMKRTTHKLTLPVAALFVALTLLWPASAAASDSDTAVLWEEVQRLDAAIQVTHGQARADVRRGMNASALLRYLEVMAQTRKEIALLDALFERESKNLDRQMQVLTDLGRAKDLRNKAQDMVDMLKSAGG